MKKRAERIPKDGEIVEATFRALKYLGGSGTNEEILNRIILDLDIPDDVIDIPHNGKPNQSELSYRANWARTYLRLNDVIENSARAVWSIRPDYADEEEVDGNRIIAKKKTHGKKETVAKTKSDEEKQDEYEEYEIEESWRERLSNILQNMDPYGFERLAQRVLRECGFSQVEVTKKSGDGGIDGTGKLRINGIFSFNVAFQCKRYKGLVGAGDIRDFRGSLTTDIEKGVLITTGTFSQAAREEATNPGKQQIDLIDGDEFISKIAEYGIGVKPITVYEIDEDFFNKI